MNKLLLYSLSLFFLAQASEMSRKEGHAISQKLDQLVKEHKDSEYCTVHDYKLNPVLHKANGDNINDAAAGFWLSKFAVHATAQTIYALVAGVTALVYPPAAPVVYCSLQLTFAAFVEMASNMVAGKTM